MRLRDARVLVDYDMRIICARCDAVLMDDKGTRGFTLLDLKHKAESHEPVCNPAAPNEPGKAPF